LIEAEGAFITPRYVATSRRADVISVGTAITRRLRATDGFALPTVYFTLIAAFAVVTVGVMATINTQRGTVRDQQTKAALQLAETATNEAVLHYNRLLPSSTNRCSPVTSSPPDANGWCTVGSQPLNGGSFRYYVKAPPVGADGRFCPASAQSDPLCADGNVTMKVVGVGNMGATTRRLLVNVMSLGTRPFSSVYKVQAAGNVTLNGNSRIHSGVSTNGGVSIASNARVCGPVSVGVGQAVSGSGTYYNDEACTQQSTGYTQQSLTLAAIGPVPATSNNGNLFTVDRVSAGNKSKACFDGHDGNQAPSSACPNRRLDLQQNTSVALTGSTYVFCKLTMSSNTSLLIPSNTPEPVVIWFDSPENCADSSDPSCLPNSTSPCVQLNMDSNSRITSNGGGTSDVQLRFVGSPTRRSTVNLSSNSDANAACQQNMIIYAPYSDVTVSGGGNLNQAVTYCGALAGRTVTLNSNVDVTAGRDNLILQSQYPYYQAAKFVECKAAPASAPNFDAGC
jgi:hypothetical protein